MRWTYEKPEEKTFVSDGRKLYSYIPADRQVYVTTVPPEDEASTPALFLAGKGNLLRDFDVSLAPPDLSIYHPTPQRTVHETEEGQHHG